MLSTFSMPLFCQFPVFPHKCYVICLLLHLQIFELPLELANTSPYVLFTGCVSGMLELL